MIRFVTDREEFAARRRPILERGEVSIEPAVRAALEAYGAPNWYEPILLAAEVVFRDTFRNESGDATHPNLDDFVQEYLRDLAESLEKTKAPTPENFETKVASITRAVSTGAVNGGTFAATVDAQGAGGPDLALEWVTMRDEAVRHTHRAADGQVVPLGGRFRVGGYPMRYPGDPTVPVELWINCRCVARPTLSEEIGLVAAGAPRGVGVFALPAADDPVVGISSEDHPHVTMLWFGTTDTFDQSVLDLIRGEITEVAAAFAPFSESVSGVATLGSEDADVLLLDAQNLASIRTALATTGTIQAAVEAVEQFPVWIPHLTRGYPDTPGGPETPESIRFDRLALWVGEDREEFPLGGAEMTDVTAAAAVEDEDDVDTSDLEDVPTLPEDADLPLVPWYGVLAPEGVPSGDRRKFAPESLGWRDLPLPLAYQRESQEGHDGSFVIGRIDNIWRDEGLIKAEGVFRDTPEASDVIQQVVDGFIRGVSVDADDAEMEVQSADGQTLSEGEFTDDALTVFTQGRICGATVCSIPAFQEAFVAIGTWADAERVAEMPTTGEQAREEVTASVPPKTKDAPGWITHPKETERLRHYWAHGPGAAKIRWGQPRDFYRCRTQLRKYVPRPDHLDGLCANIHYDALGFWPGNHRGGAHSGETATAPAVNLVNASCLECLTSESGEEAIVASARPAPPAEWFTDPKLTGPSPIVVDEHGRVFGHLATWGTCHIGFGEQACVTPPESASQYAYFKTGSVLTSDGQQVPVGQITMGTGHARPSLKAAATLAHYDNTGSAVADVAAGEDQYGIWISGAVRPGVTDEQVAMLRASALSGDWRKIGKGLELVAALAVNVPGFPIPRTSLAASGGEQISLVAAGIVQTPEPPVTLDAAAIADAVIARIQASQRRERMGAVRARAQALIPTPKDRMAALAAKVERGR